MGLSNLGQPLPISPAGEGSMADNTASGRTAPVWAKRVGDAAVAEKNVDFCAGYDMAGRQPADERLAPHDLCTNAAHLLMLTGQEIVTSEVGSQCAQALLQLRERVARGENLLLPGCEDIHMSIETHIGQLAGAFVAGHLHTARSRNDQVATDMRLWLREEIAAFAEEVLNLIETIATHAAAHTETVCPGFTHGQPGMVTSWGHWTMSYLPRFVRVLRQLPPLLRDLSTCPLGAAACYGTSWPIDRRRTATLLGFRHPTPSGTDGIWSRGELEGRFGTILAQFLGHLSSVGQDMILLSSPPRDWLRLADEHVTGSSIMPQKRNPDFAEVTRSRAHVAVGYANSLQGIGVALPSGYNRDSQWTKYLAMDAADNARGAGDLFAAVFSRIQVNAPSMRAACDEGFLNATDVADYIASSRRLPFRQCYRFIGPTVKDCEPEGRITLPKLNARLEQEGITPLSEGEWQRLEDPTALLRQRQQPGNPAPESTSESIGILLAEAREEAETVRTRAAQWHTQLDRLFDELKELAGN